MTRRPPWLDPSSTQAAIGLAILAAIANGIWILLNDSSPSWDQSHYLATTLQYQHALDSGGPIDLLRSIHSADPSHGPLFTVLMLPFFYLFGAGNESGLVLNLLVAPIFYFAAGEIAWILFRSWFARLLTIALVATMPLMVGLFHNVLQDFLLVTLTTVSLLLLLRSEGFQRRWTTIAMGLAMGLGTLTKVTFPLFVAGPFLVIAVKVVAERVVAHREGNAEERATQRRTLLNLAGAAVVFLVVAFAWYGPTFSQTLDYIRSTTSGPLSLGAGPSNPYTFHAVTSFTTVVVNLNLSWVILLLGLLAVALNGSRLRALLSRPLRWDPLWKLAFLLAWALIPYLSVALAHNQDVRLMAPALPAVAVLAAGAVSAIRWPRLRIALAGVAVTILTYQTLNHVTDVTPGIMPERATVDLGSYQQVVEFGSEPIGYEQLPGDDYGTAVIEYIEEVAEAEPGGLEVPRSLCVLESEPVINSNTLGFIAASRGDAFAFTDVANEAGWTPRKLEVALSGCNFAIYVKQAEVSPAGVGSRLELVNEPYAANHMTPRQFRLFRGPSRSFPLSPDPNGPEDRVQVLVRTAGEGPIGG